MKSEITLNEQQMNLLAEFIEADKAYKATKKAVGESDQQSDDFDRLVNKQVDAYQSRRIAACIFADSVAEEATHA